MIEVIRARHGIIVDFLGDAILAFFDPLEQSLAETVSQAVACALEMQTAQAAANAAEPQYPALRWHRPARRGSSGGQHRL